MIFRLTLSVVLCCLISACSKKVAIEESIRPVVTVKVSKQGQNSTRRFSGIAKADDEIDLSFRISGIIKKLFVSSGEAVNKGQLIASLDSIDQELSLKKEEANIAQTTANLKQAKNEYERSISLYEANNISKSELDSEEATYLSTKAQLAANIRGFELAQQDLKYTKLYAPAEGVISEKPVSENQVVTSGQVIAVLQVAGPIKVEFGVSESMINSLKLGQKSKVKFDFISDKVFPARVSKIGVSTDSSTAYPVEVSILTNATQIRPGMVCDVEVEFASNSDTPATIVLPSLSVIGDVTGKNYVWVFDEQSSTSKKQEVKIGALVNDGVQILQGLDDGDLVITKGVNTLEEGMKVRLL